MTAALSPSFLNIIQEIVHSVHFYQRLNEINLHFFNLKQESHIRNALLIELNQYFHQHDLAYSAISEYPRINNTRVDLSIVDLETRAVIYKVEFKFQLIGDYKARDLVYRHREVEYDFVEKDSDLFVLIVIDWDDMAKRAYDLSRGFVSSLTQYNKGDNQAWPETVQSIFAYYPQAEFQQSEKISLNSPYATDYHFYYLAKPTAPQASSVQI